MLQVDGIVMPPDGPGSWPPNNSKRQWLVFYRADGMTLRGSGLIDGRGEKWWDLPCKPHRVSYKHINSKFSEIFYLLKTKKTVFFFFFSM